MGAPKDFRAGFAVSRFFRARQKIFAALMLI